MQHSTAQMLSITSHLYLHANSLAILSAIHCELNRLCRSSISKLSVDVLVMDNIPIIIYCTFCIFDIFSTETEEKEREYFMPTGDVRGREKVLLPLLFANMAW